MSERPFGRKFQGKRFTGTLEEYLLERSAVDPATGCRNWLMSTAGEGYGYFLWRGVWTYAHRASHQVWKGEIPIGMHVLHRCDNMLCINSDHLFLGTQDDNMKDMSRKGRGRGQKKPRVFPGDLPCNQNQTG